MTSVWTAGLPLPGVHGLLTLAAQSMSDKAINFAVYNSYFVKVSFYFASIKKPPIIIAT